MQAPVTMHKALKCQVNMKLLDDSTKTFFLKNFGCARKVYNLYVDFLYKFLENINYTPGSQLPNIKLPEVTEFKKQYSYLKEADSLGLANAKQAFEAAIKRYNDEYDHKSYTKRAIKRDKSGKEPLSFRGLKGMPKFHSKANGDFSYTTNCQYPAENNKLTQPTIRLNGNELHLPKMKKNVSLILHQNLPVDAVIGNVTMSMDIDGRIYASIEYTYTKIMNMDLRIAAMQGDSSILEKLSFISLDYDQKDFYVDNEGRKANYPKYYRESQEKLARLQHNLSRMVKDSNNYKKQLHKIQLLHIRIRNQRKDWVTKQAVSLAKNYDVVIVEDINLNAMGQTLSLGKNLHDNGFGMFRNILEKKLNEKGSVLVRVDKWFPSTKTCSCCGYKNDDINMTTTEWICPKCGAHHDRDINAATNIVNEGKRILLEYFCHKIEEERQAQTRAENLSAGRKRKKNSAA